MYRLREIKVATGRGAGLQLEKALAAKPDELLPSAGDFMKKLALAQAEEASKQARQIAEAEAEKQALLDRLKKPSGLSDEEAIQRAIKIIERAVANPDYARGPRFM
jgi:uncharacterized protein (DUF1778 family)